MKKILFSVLFILGILTSFTWAEEINSGNITQAPYNCAIDATYCDLNSKGITGIATDTFINHSNLSSLYLEQNQIASIESGDFAGLSNLTQLLIINNQITSIENGSFLGLSNLSYLSLDNNQITSIESGDFAGLSSLSTLYIEENQITSIESDDFAELSSLSDLNIQNNQITSIESGSFLGLSNLIYLNLAANQITSIESSSFLGLSNLTDLNLEQNQIASIESGDFAELSSLSSLYLYNNQITSIESGDFAGLSNLTELSLYNNPIYHIDNNAFDALINLGTLDIYDVCFTIPISINYAGGSSSTDNNFCSIVDLNDSNSFINGLADRGYSNYNGLGLLWLSEDYYIGSSPISFLPGVTDEILANIVMQSQNNNGYIQDYYQNTVEVQLDSGTLLTSNGQAFTGLLQGPLLINTGVVKGLNNVVAITKFGDFQKRVDFSKPVTIRLPALGKNIDDVVDIFYSQNLSSNWSFHGTSTVIDIAGVPYIEFTTDHATYFAIGEGTGSFVINNDAISTTSQSVTLNISGAMTYMRFSNDLSNRSTWEAISDTKSRDLSAGTGTKTVYAEFDIDGDFTGDISTSDTIEYIDGVSGIGVQGNISLEITGGVSECIYGTSLYLGEQDVKLNSGYTFTGSFSGQRYCADYVGISSGRVFTIGVSDLDNGNGGIISGSNLSISHGGAITQGDSACTGYDGAASEFYTTPYTLIEKAIDSNKICKVTLDSVDIEINVPANQAPGNYAGTLTIYVPNF